ncbi:hypothetical protein ATL17_2957 [Maritalea mobilis]|uniref:Uncharacterized protein n=1 Tax=Maritalea mobilis TaxID=483324 RepID=A0A4R6VH01_9HYPH|nr:hypothetical protein ATL17_2957 [Maritalea mobilis]
MPLQIASIPFKSPLLRKIIHFAQRGPNLSSPQPRPKKTKYSTYHLSPHLRRDLGIEPYGHIKRGR